MNRIIVIILAIVTLQGAYATNDNDTTDINMLGINQTNNKKSKDITYKLKYPVKGWDNSNFTLLYYDDKYLYNLRSFRIYKYNDLQSVKLHPAGSAYTILGTDVSIHSFFERRKRYYNFIFGKDEHPVDFSYTADAQDMVIVLDNKKLVWYHMSQNKPCVKLNQTISDKDISIDPYNYFIKDNTLYVIDQNTWTLSPALRCPSNISRVVFAPNNNEMGILTQYGKIDVFDSKTLELKKTIFNLPFNPEHWCVSPNKFYVALTQDKVINVINIETGNHRADLRCGARINDVAFSSDSRKMGILTQNGKLEIYDTKTFELKLIIDSLGEARKCYFHPNGKYVYVMTSNHNIAIVNIKNNIDRRNIQSDHGEIVNISGAMSLDSVFYLIYNSGKYLHFKSMQYLTPNYQKIVEDKADQELSKWQKQMKGESTEDYHERVNEKTRDDKYAELKYDLSTQLAGNKIDTSVVSIGDYDVKNHALEIKFDNLPHIYLKMTKGDIADIADASDLIFENSKYTVDEKDNFELMYTEVTNKRTGKKYIYDNRTNQLDDGKILNNATLIPIEIVRQSSDDEAILEEIKDSIVHEIISTNLISDQTHISVKTRVEPSVNAEGENTLNYHIDFNYFVDLEYSTRDDYKPGQYKCTQSEAAMAMLKCVTQAFSEHFEPYLTPGKKVIIELYGSADATPISGAIDYDGLYGEFTNSLIYNKGELVEISVTKSEGIQSNEQLAFLRAISVQDYVDNNIEKLAKMATEYKYNISVSEQSGAEYRRIGIRFTFVDTFK